MVKRISKNEFLKSKGLISEMKKLPNDVEYTIDPETGKFATLKIKGKKKGVRDINKAKATPYWKMYSGAGIGYNRFSGAPAELSAFERTIFEWCMGWCSRYERGDYSIPTQVYDNVKYILLALNPDAWMVLMD